MPYFTQNYQTLNQMTKASCRCSLNPGRLGTLLTFWGSLLQKPPSVSVESLFLNTQSGVLLMQFPSTSLCPITDHQREEVVTSPTTYPLEGVLQVILQTSLLQDEQSQMLCVSLALETFHHLDLPLLEALQ